MSTAPPRVLTIAGSDSGGGAGIQADLKTFQELGVFGTSAITALTAQNTVGVHGVHEVPVEFVRLQIDVVLGDIGADAVKTGMLADAPIIEEVAEALREHEIPAFVLDPVAMSKHGDPLLRPEAVTTLRDELVPLATVITPNAGEMALLTGVEVRRAGDLREAAEALLELGPRWVLAKGGHLAEGEDAVDLLTDGTTWHELRSERIATEHTHGTGCTLASAIAAELARGQGVVEAVEAAKRYVTGAIGRGLAIGRGIGPVDHGWARRS